MAGEAGNRRAAKVLGESAKKRFKERFHPDRVMVEILKVSREAIEWAQNRRKEF
jgi:hypothetical protein